MISSPQFANSTKYEVLRNFILLLPLAWAQIFSSEAFSSFTTGEYKILVRGKQNIFPCEDTAALCSELFD
jgi:hypothetical protein